MKYLITTFLMVCLTAQVMSQVAIKSRPIYKDGNRNKGIEKIVFTDEQDSQLGEFDIITSNPFNRKVSVPVSFSNEIVPISARSLSSVIRHSSRYINPEDKIAKYARTRAIAVENEELSIQAMMYKMELFDDREEEIGEENQFIILDENGSIRNAFTTEYDAHAAVISSDAKFVGFNYGGEINHYGYRLFNEGMCVYDASTGQIIFQKEINESQFLSPPVVANDLIIYAVTSGV
ncbi:MAG: hypothetical protein AAF391_06330, partial [Bacteroidota bacterium]